MLEAPLYLNPTLTGVNLLDQFGVLSFMRHQVVMFSFLGDSSVFKHYDFIAVFEVLQLMGDEQDSFFSQFLFDAFEEYVFSNVSVNGGERIV